jgi:hypothetical protein
VTIVGVAVLPPRFLNKKIRPTIRPNNKRAPSKYQIQLGHPDFLVFFFSTTGAGTFDTNCSLT